MQIANNQFILVHTVGPIQDIFLVFGKQSGPVRLGRILQINRYQTVIWSIFIGAENHFRSVIRDVLKREPQIQISTVPNLRSS